MRKSNHAEKTIFLIVAVMCVSSILVTSNMLDADAYKKIKKYQNIIENKTSIQFNKYSNYVHLQPEWNSYPRNILFDVTTQWAKEHNTANMQEQKQNQPHQGAHERTNQLQYLEGKPYLEVKYDYIDCSYQWIHYARQGTDMFASYMDYITGKQKESDNFTTFTKIQNDDKRDSSKLDSSNVYSQFIPICTSKENTSFDYGVRIDDDNLSFDVYFVPSIEERHNYHYNQEGFTFYDEKGCFGENYQSFSGTCNVNENAGLLIVIPDEINRSLAKVTVKLKEN